MANGYVFLVDNDDMGDEEGPVFFITTEEFWNANHHIDDEYLYMGTEIPPDFQECVESGFDYVGAGDPVQILLALGFKQVEDR